MGSSCGRVPATGRGPAGAEGARRGARGGARPGGGGGTRRRGLVSSTVLLGASPASRTREGLLTPRSETFLSAAPAAACGHAGPGWWPPLWLEGPPFLAGHL